MLPHFRPLPAERVGLAAALGRFVAGELRARHDLPPFDNSAMDGYALAFSAPLAPGDLLPVTGQARAGSPASQPLSPGEAARIFTGAPLPDGADTVLIQENTEPVEDDGSRIRVTHVPLKRGQHVRSRGSDVRADEPLLPAGQQLGPGEIALLAGQGFASVDVHARPRVAIVATGDELRDVGQGAEPGTVVNTNAYSLAAQVQEAGGIPWVLPPFPDDLEAITRGLTDASVGADVVVSAGGVSVGDFDLVGKAFARADVKTHFWKVAMKPGKPVLFGTLRDTPIVGLPGNPVSATVTFELFVRPGLQQMAGSRRPFRATATIELAHDHRHAPGRVELARAQLAYAPDHAAPPRATLHSSQGSGSLRSMCDVHALVILPAEREVFEAGERLQAVVLPAGHSQARHPFGGGNG